MFYVYEWYNKESGFVFYVGKGCNNRYKSKCHRNILFKNYVKENDCDVRIIRKFENEEDAFQFEHQHIVTLKKRGEAICNLDDGGVGGVRFIWTDEMRSYKSKYNPMKDEKQKKRMSQNNPMKDPKVAEKVSSTKRRAVIIGLEEYPSVISAAKHFGVCQPTIEMWCRKGINPSHEKCRYKDSEQVEYSGKRYNIGGCRPLTYNGKNYESPIDLAREIGLSNSTIVMWAKRGFDPSGNRCQYDDDKSVHVFKKWENGSQARKPLYVNGVLYPSKADAEKALGLCKGYLAPYLAGTRKNNKYICKYANQQPSQGNTDNSTLEGSTTNG